MRTFLIFDDCGDATEQGLSDCRSSCELVNDTDYELQFDNATPILKLSEMPRFRIEPPFPLEDMPWTSGPHTISNRLRRFLDSRAPRHAQFFEAEFCPPAATFDETVVTHMLPKGRDKYKSLFPNGFDAKVLRPNDKYFVVNWLFALSCADESQSIRDSEPNDPAISYEVLAVDPSKVPDNVLIFRPKEQLYSVYIDTHLAIDMVNSGFTGIQFYPIGDEFPPDWPWR